MATDPPENAARATPPTAPAVGPTYVAAQSGTLPAPLIPPGPVTGQTPIAPGPVARKPVGLRRMFIALRHRNFRLYWLGQMVSVSGTWVQSTAQAWLVLKLTNSALALGLVTTLQFLPMMLAGPLGGVLADRLDKRRALIGTQTAAGLLAAALGLLTATGRVTVPAIDLVALLLGVVNTVDNPVRQAFVIEMVGREELPNAVALNSTVFNTARVIGPAFAGLLIGAVGMADCFWINAASFVPVIGGLIAMRPAELFRPVVPAAGRVWAAITEAAGYAVRSRDVALIIGLMAVIGTFGMNFQTLLPLLAKQKLHVGAFQFGVLTSSLGLGSLIGALALAGVGRANRAMVLAGATGFAILETLLAFIPSFSMSTAVLLGVGLFSILYTATSNSMLQLLAPDALRGRLMSFYAYVFLGTTPVGAMAVSGIAQWAGPGAAFALGGLSGLAAVATACIWLGRGGRLAANGGYPEAR